MDIGNYTLLNQLSGGRYGAIWKAHDPTPRPRRRAQATGPGDTGSARRGSSLEAQHAGRLRHPNIVETEPPVTDDNGIWLVEEWVAGASLADVAGRRPAPAAAAARGGPRCAARAWRTPTGTTSCTAACRRGRSWSTADGTPKLVEFGAWLGHPDAAGIGAYASPEAFAGEPIAPPSDVYSAGAVISPGAGQDPDPADAEATGSCSTTCKPVLDRAMAPDSGQRHPDGQALLDDLDRAARSGRSGAAWWTTEGLGAIAASSAAATLAASGTATAGGVGAVAGTGAAELRRCRRGVREPESAGRRRRGGRDRSECRRRSPGRSPRTPPRAS